MEIEHTTEVILNDGSASYETFRCHVEPPPLPESLDNPDEIQDWLELETTLIPNRHVSDVFDIGDCVSIDPDKIERFPDRTPNHEIGEISELLLPYYED